MRIGLTILAILFVWGVSYSQWSFEVVDVQGCAGRNNSIALDQLENPGIAYRTCGGINLKYAYFDGTDWLVEEVDNSTNTGVYPSLDYDSSGNPHITYMDFTNRDLKYAYWNGNEWVVSTVDNAEDTGWFSSMMLDDSDHPHVCYQDRQNGVLKYAEFNGSQWIIGDVDSTGSIEAFPSLKLDSQNNPRISYCRIESGTATLNYAWSDGGPWHSEVIDNGGISAGKFSSLQLDGAENPHISYALGDQTTEGLRYAYHDGAEWIVNTVISGSNSGYNTSLVLTFSDEPRISFLMNDSDLAYASWGSGEWTIDLLSQSSLGETSLVLDSSDKPSLSFWGAGETMNYATMTTSGMGEDENTGFFLRPVQNPVSGSQIELNYSVFPNSAAELTVYGLSGRMIHRSNLFSQEDGSGIAGLPSLSPGLYICRITSHGESVTSAIMVIK